jgi:hypothetical protein
LLADCGYWTIANLTTIPGAPELLIPPAKHGRQGTPRKDGRPSESRSDGLRAAMTAKLASDDGKARYAKRKVNRTGSVGGSAVRLVSRSHRQQVTGLPQPSWRVGSSRQGMPVRSW